MNLEACGPEEIRAAFQVAVDDAAGRSEELGSIVSVLSEAADRYETLQMQPSTVGHLRDAAAAFTTGQTALTDAQEQLRAALADFNTRDGQVADAVADAGGTLASKEILMGDGSTPTTASTGSAGLPVAPGVVDGQAEVGEVLGYADGDTCHGTDQVTGDGASTSTTTGTGPRREGKDRLKLAGRMDLQAGENLIDSDMVTGDGGAIRVAVTDGDGALSLRLGLGGPAYGGRDDDAGPWRGGPDATGVLNAERGRRRDERDAIEAELNRLDADPAADPARKAALESRYGDLDEMDLHEVYPSGYTGRLDPAAAQQLRTTLTDALVVGAKAQAVIDGHWNKRDRLEAVRDSLRGMGRKWTAEENARWDAATAAIQELESAGAPDWDYTIFAEGSVPGTWADVHYRVDLDDPAIGVQVTLGAVPQGSDLTLDELDGNETAATLNPAEATKLLRILGRHTGADQA